MSDAVGTARARPMPAADAATVRLAALRAAELAAELRAVHAALNDAMGQAAGWSGTAELAFQESVSSQLSQFVPAVQRYEGYAAAFGRYAGELEWLVPRLRAARSRLDSAGGGGGGLGAAGPAAGPVAAADFERWWAEWDAARGRCMAGLAWAGGFGADPRRSGWSRLVAGVPHVVPGGVGLADLSRVLAELAEGLVVAGVVLSLVCPPAAGAVWAAVAVVAVCQLVVDASRRERGEPVGPAQLGWDALGVLPVGRLVSGARSAAEASAEIERLAPELRSSRLVPGGGLAAHEGTASYRGHTLLKHVGQTPEQLAERFEDEPDLRWSSSFKDRHVAENAVAQVLDNNREQIRNWLGQPQQVLRLTVDIGAEIGQSVAHSGTIVSASKVRVVLRKEGTMLGYYIKTAYPKP